MKHRSTRPVNARAFKIVAAVGRTLPDVEAATRYDGSPVLRIHGVFLAGLATHPSAAPNTLVVRSEIEDRELLLSDAPDTYYVTDYYRPYPVVLVRLAAIDRDALHELLSISRRLAAAKTRPRRRPDGRGPC
jgi:hypothetical protein